MGKSRALIAIFGGFKPDVAVSLQAHANLVLLTAAALSPKRAAPR